MFQQALGRVAIWVSVSAEYADPEPVGRSTLVSWLTHPNEWECAPDEIELMGVVDEDVYVYQFRTNEGHWTSRDGWVAGIAGRATFSDYTAAN